MAEEYLNKINNAVSTASAGINTAVSVKKWVNPDAGGGLGGMAASALSGGLGGALGGLAGGLGGKLGGLMGGAGGGAGLMFPTDLGSATSMNYMGFQAFEIVGGIGSAKSDRDYEMKGEPVYLPIPDSGINEPFTQNWGQGDVSMFEASLAQTAAGQGQNIRDALATGNLATGAMDAAMDAGSNVVKGAKEMGEAAISLATGEGWDKVGQGVLSGLESALNIANSKGVAQAAIGLGMQAAGQPLSQAAGLAGFKETAYLYQGPGFRPFSFNFSLKPTSASESTTINKIIDFFRSWGQPTENAGDLYRIYSLPAAFEIKFYHSAGENMYLPKLGKCVLTGFNAKYGGDRFSTFSGSHAPVQVDLSMNFVEIELQTRFANEQLAAPGMDGMGLPSVGGFANAAKGAVGGAVGAATSAIGGAFP